jgi:hypothetical protein
MYGLKPDSLQYLSHLTGGEVQQVCVGKYDLQFHLHPTGNISVWSRCELLGADGSVADTWEDGLRSERFLFADLLGGTVSEVTIPDTKTLRIAFADGRHLVIYDTSEQYESFSVGKKYV